MKEKSEFKSHSAGAKNVTAHTEIHRTSCNNTPIFITWRGRSTCLPPLEILNELSYFLLTFYGSPASWTEKCFSARRTGYLMFYGNPKRLIPWSNYGTLYVLGIVLRWAVQQYLKSLLSKFCFLSLRSFHFYWVHKHCALYIWQYLILSSVLF